MLCMSYLKCFGENHNLKSVKMIGRILKDYVLLVQMTTFLIINTTMAFIRIRYLRE